MPTDSFLKRVIQLSTRQRLKLSIVWKLPPIHILELVVGLSQRGESGSKILNHYIQEERSLNKSVETVHLAQKL